MAHESVQPSITHLDCRQSLPARPTGSYVVVDVFHFSTTVIELLECGAERIHVPDERGREFDYRAVHPDALLGGPKTDDYEPIDGYDFINSPSYVQDLDVTGRPVSFTSTNGGRTVADLRERGGADLSVYVGSTTNAAAVGRHLRATAREVTVVSAGTDGEPATEDHVGAALIDGYLRGDPPTRAARRDARERLRAARGPDYATKNAVRNADVTRYAMALNSRSVVPKLVDGHLVDAPTDRESGETVGSVA